MVFNKTKQPSGAFPLILCLLALLSISPTVCSGETSPENSASLSSDLRHKPIQPLKQAKELNPHKVSLGEAVSIMAKHQLGRTLPGQDILHIIAVLESLPGEYRGQPLGHKP